MLTGSAGAAGSRVSAKGGQDLSTAFVLEVLPNVCSSAGRHLPQSLPGLGLTPTTALCIAAGLWLPPAQRLGYSSIPMHKGLLPDCLGSLWGKTCLCACSARLCPKLMLPYVTVISILKNPPQASQLIRTFYLQTCQASVNSRHPYFHGRGFYKRQNSFEVTPLCPSGSPSTGSAVGSPSVPAAPAANPQPEPESHSGSVMQDGSTLRPAMRLLKDYSPLECKGEGGVSSAPGLSPPEHHHQHPGAGESFTCCFAERN